MPSKREQFYDDQFSKGKSRFVAVEKDVLRIYIYIYIYIVATRKTRYVSDNKKGLGCGLNKGKMCVSAKYCYVTHELRLHQNDRCKRLSLF